MKMNVRSKNALKTASVTIHKEATSATASVGSFLTRIRKTVATLMNVVTKICARRMPSVLIQTESFLVSVKMDTLDKIYVMILTNVLKDCMIVTEMPFVSIILALSLVNVRKDRTNFIFQLTKSNLSKGTTLFRQWQRL